MISAARARQSKRNICSFAAAGALLLSSPALAQDAEGILNFARSIGDVVGCGGISEDEGHALLGASAKAASGLASETDLKQAYDDGVRVGKSGFCDLIKEHPEIIQKLRDSAKRQLSLGTPSFSSADDAAIDAQKQRETLSTLATDPSNVLVPYNPDPKIADKAAAVQSIYNAWIIALRASECGLLPEYAFKPGDPIHSDPLGNIWYHNLGALVPDGRDFEVASEHNERVFERAHPGLFAFDEKGQWCGRLAQSPELLDVKKRLQGLK